MNSNAMTTITHHFYLTAQHHSIFKTNGTHALCEAPTFYRSQYCKNMHFLQILGTSSIPSAECQRIRASAPKFQSHILHVESYEKCKHLQSE